MGAATLSVLPPDKELNKLLSLRKGLVLANKAEHGTVKKAKDTELYKQYKHVKSQISSREARRRRHAAKSQRKAYFRDVGTREIERQVTSIGEPEPDYVEPIVYHETSERRRLVQLLCDFSTNLGEDRITQRRIEAINNIVVLCGWSEPQPRKKSAINTRRALRLKSTDFSPNQYCPATPTADCAVSPSLLWHKAVIAQTLEIPIKTGSTAYSSSSWGGAVLSHPLNHTSLKPDVDYRVANPLVPKDLFPFQCHPAQCPFCIGDITRTLSERTFIYSRPAKIMDYVEKIHLSGSVPGEQIACRYPKCQKLSVHLDNLPHSKNHVRKIHGIVLRA